MLCRLLARVNKNGTVSRGTDVELKFVYGILMVNEVISQSLINGSTLTYEVKSCHMQFPYNGQTDCRAHSR